MTDPGQPPGALPAIAVTLLTSPGAPGRGTWVHAQVTSYANAEALGLDTLYYGLLLSAWELVVCADGSHAELHCRDAGTTIALVGDWQTALRHLRTLLADPRVDLLLAMTIEPAE